MLQFAIKVFFGCLLGGDEVLFSFCFLIFWDILVCYGWVHVFFFLGISSLMFVWWVVELLSV